METQEDDDGGTLHTPESVEFTLKQLRKAIGQIEVSLDEMRESPSVSQVRVHRESSRVAALARLNSWSDALRDAIGPAKEKLLRPVSDSTANGEKASKNSASKLSIVPQPDTEQKSKRRGKTQ